MRAFYAVGFALALIVSPVTGQALVQTSPSGQAKVAFQSWVSSLQGEGTNVSFDKADLDSASDTLNVDNFAMSFAGNSSSDSSKLTAAKLSLVAFSSSGTTINFSSATIDSLQLTAQSNQQPSMTIAKLELGPGSIPTFQGFISDPARPITTQVEFLKRLSKADIETITASDLQWGGAATVHQLRLAGVEGGKVKAVDLASVQATWAQPSDGSLAVSSASLADLDLGSYVRLFDPSAYLEAGSSRPDYSLIGKSSFNGLKLSNGALSVNIEQGATGALKVRQFERDLTQIFDAAMASQTYLAENPASAEAIANAMRGSISLEGVSLSGAAAAGLNTGTFDKVSAGSATLANLTANHFDKLSFENLTAGGPDQTLSARTLELSQVDLATLKATEGSGAPEGARTVPTVGAVKIADLSTSSGGKTYGVKSVDVAMSYFIGAMPTRVKGTIGSLQFQTSQIEEPGLRQTLKDLGYEAIDLSFDVSATWQDAASAVAVDTLKLTGVGMGTLSASGTLTGVSDKSMSNPGSVLPSELLAGGLQNFRLSFENTGLFDRAIDHAAKVNGKASDELRRAIASNMPAIMSQISDAGTRNKFVFAGVSFVNNPKSLDLVSTTPDAIAIRDIVASLNNPLALPVVLKLDASANQRN
ncbi:hypothetical protein [Rhizobium sp. BE258]|uniref:hypothetical protein n=1 Tax=Rhizobium sp. BE258 TaxID=2817722 RepID=UPI00285A3DF1|nr:hypothetical protein [Rhizobium sp. BE258]MDR7145213.1 hypothetical protein [Rhizobium sp. BE258]